MSRGKAFSNLLPQLLRNLTELLQGSLQIFHDLSRLNQLYRIGAFIGVAVVLMVASWLYQRFLATQNKSSEPSV